MSSGGNLVVGVAAVVALVGAASFIHQHAFAASDAAWAEFRAEVESACLDAAAPQMADASARVDPFGSESFGLALVSGAARGAPDARVSAICVYDKETGEVEIGGELPRA